MERMLLQAALNVRMAEAQRKLYRHYVRVAKEHTLTNRPHSIPVRMLSLLTLDRRWRCRALIWSNPDRCTTFLRVL